MPEREPFIIADFYQGGYGPTVLVKLMSHEAVEWLHEAVLAVASGAPLDLQNQPRVSLTNISAFHLRRVNSDSVAQLVVSENGVDFACTREKWIELAGLLEPFLEGRKGHQYLNSSGTDDAVIEVSYGEQDA